MKSNVSHEFKNYLGVPRQKTGRALRSAWHFATIPNAEEKVRRIDMRERRMIVYLAVCLWLIAVSFVILPAFHLLK
jgi:hypothetical protein